MINIDIFSRVIVDIQLNWQEILLVFKKKVVVQGFKAKKDVKLERPNEKPTTEYAYHNYNTPVISSNSKKQKDEEPIDQVLAPSEPPLLLSRPSKPSALLYPTSFACKSVLIIKTQVVGR